MHDSWRDASLKQAASFLVGIAERQSPGWTVIAAKQENGRGEPGALERVFLDNRSPALSQVIKQALRRFWNKDYHLYYGVNAFSRRGTKASDLAPITLAQVDGDKVPFPPPGPTPTISVETSPGNFQYLYALDTALVPDEAQNISRYLTKLTRGDPGGHSAAKLLRVPGTPNLKPDYDPTPIVRIVSQSDQIHTSSDLLRDARRGGLHANSARILDLRRASELDGHGIIDKYWPKLEPDIRQRLRQRQVMEPWRLRLGDHVYSARRDNCSNVIYAIGSALHRAGASDEEVIAALQVTVFWIDRERRGKHEDPASLVAKIAAMQAEENAAPNGHGVLKFIDPGDLDGLPIPTREWVIPEWVPSGKVTALYGDGGVGKTTLGFQMGVSIASEVPFLGMEIKAGKVMALLAENDEDDTHIALAPILRGYGLRFADLKGRMLIASRLGFDNALQSFVDGHPEWSELFGTLLDQAITFEPTLIILDTAADLFAGNENDRFQVRSFVADSCGRLARETGAAVLLCAHPSQSGLRTGEGSGGSTAWNNTVRSRIYLRQPNDQGPEFDSDLRVLEVKKANFASRGRSLDLRYEDGWFVVDSGRRPLSEAQQRVIDEVARAFDIGEPWSAHPQAGNRWLGEWIMRELKRKRSEAGGVIKTLMYTGAIVDVAYDPHRHRTGLATPAQAARHQRAKEARRSET